MPELPPGAWNAHWISISADPREDMGVFGFRRKFMLAESPQELRVRVSADQRYKLYVNGQFVRFGPQRGDVLHWFYETYDIAPYLNKGENWIAALVWNFGRWAPMAQHTARTGFVLEVPNTSTLQDINTSLDWQVARLKNWSFDMMHSEDMNFYIDIGPGEIMDFRGAPWGWRTGEDAAGLADWRKPNLVCRAEERGTMGGMTPWSLVPRALPAMRYEPRQAAPKIRRGFAGDSAQSDVAEGSDLADEMSLELGRKYLLDYQELLTAYPRLTVSGPAGTVVVLSYAEGMWQEKGGKGNRNEVVGKKMSGYQDKIVLDGERRTIEPLWWRTYRYLMIECVPPTTLLHEAPDAPSPSPQFLPGGRGDTVTLHQLEAVETGYPLKEESSFTADHPDVKPIWDVSVRTAKRCAGETYFDCPYYEQLQYVGDTRIQALIGYYLGRDRKLQRNAVETLGWSLMENGLTQSRYPSRQPQIIPPFSLWWVMMLWDQLFYDLDRLDHSRIEQAHTIAREFGELGDPGNSFWCFGDWVPDWGWGVPPSGVSSPMHVLNRLLAELATYQFWLGHLENRKELSPIAKLENGLVSQIIKEQHISSVAGPNEHSEALFRMYQVLCGETPDPWPTEALAKANAAKCTYYFSYYKHLAMFGRGDVDPVNRMDRSDGATQTFYYMTEIAPWKEMLENGLTTFAENPEPTRSDCHAWSAHPILGFFQIVAGVTSIAPGWKKARIDPRPGSLKRFDAHIAHPDGDLNVRFEGGKLEIDSPTPFELRWKGKKEELKAGRHVVG